MLAQDVGWFRAARQAATEGLVTAPARLVGEVSFRVGGYTDKNKNELLVSLERSREKLWQFIVSAVKTKGANHKTIESAIELNSKLAADHALVQHRLGN